MQLKNANLNAINMLNNLINQQNVQQAQSE